MSLKENRDFFFDLYESQIIPECLDGIAHINNPDFNLLTNINSDKVLNTKVFYSIKSVPKYLITNYNASYKIYKIAQFHKGYSIQIDDDLASVDAYLKLQFRSKAREIRRYVKRLETCYDIEYKMHHGTISKKEYDTLFETLRVMLDARFKQKKEINDRLSEWERLFNMFYSLINEKKASIFVIYEAGTPISISLNYIFGKFYFNAIASYNLDYSKFGLGNVIIYKQLEWCINNEFDLYEMGRGDYDYKRRWSNQIYDLEHFMLVPINSNFISIILYKTEIYKIQLFEFLRSKKWNLLYNKIKNRMHFLNHSHVVNDFQVCVFENLDLLKNMKLISGEDDDYLKLKKLINDFLFSNSLHKDKVKVYKNIDENYFVIVGNNKANKIIYNNF
jgi:hypothetical protein